MHPEILVPATAQCFQTLGAQSFIAPFYLIGGTAVALHLGHRQSVDLDFVGADPIDTLQLRQSFSNCGQFTLDSESTDTLYGMLDGVKISVMKYDYPLLEPLASFQGVSVAGIKDLAAMKLDVIASRGKKRDFVDLYAIAQTGVTMQEVWQWFQKKYATLSYNQMHILKSLTYFEDADQDPDPVYLKKIAWPTVQSFFLQESRKLIP